jgi:hypothetical protein
MENYKIELKNVKQPVIENVTNVILSDETIEYRKNKVLASMNERGLDKLVVYGDVEHGNNFEYLVGYFTRFEESLLVIDKSGEMTLVLGNENLNKASKARVKCNSVHVSLFSLPNQPNLKDKTFRECLQEAGLEENLKVGVVGWKNFTSSLENNKLLFDVPSFIVDTIKDIVKDDSLVANETDLFIGENGVRRVNNANEIAHYEYGAVLASNCILDAMNRLEENVSELELGDALVRNGQHTSVVTIAAAGSRFVKGNMFPTERTVKLQDTISLTVGYRGGSSSRAGYAVRNTEDLPNDCKGYLDQLVFPYYKAYTAWLERIRVGMEGKEMFNCIEEVLPRAQFHWSLCPGHLVAEEEWMCSPIYENSTELLKSGMIFQIDIIPSISGLAGTCAESTVVLADEQLKEQIKKEYPEMWERVLNRISYIKEELGINLSDDVLPMCNTVACLRPYLLSKEKACAVQRG